MTNVKIQGLEDRWFKGLTKITYQLFFSVFKDIFYIMVFVNKFGRGGVKPLLMNVNNKMVIYLKASLIDMKPSYQRQQDSIFPIPDFSNV